jgi:hypothetical protein
MATLRYSVYKAIVAEIIRWNEILRDINLENSAQFAWMAIE